MTRDTIFDLASLTKPIATATSVMILIDEGRLALGDRIGRMLPELDNHGKGAITVEQLFRHRAGLVPDNPLNDYQRGADQAWKRIAELDLVSRPGEQFRYSDVGFLVLGRLVERLSGLRLDEFAREKKPSPTALRSEVATLVAAAITDAPARSEASSVLTRSAAPRLAQSRFTRSSAVSTSSSPITSRRCETSRWGSSPTTRVARAMEGPRSMCSFAPEVKLVRLFSPEHGIRGALDAAVADSQGRGDRSAGHQPLWQEPKAPAARPRRSGCTGL